MEDNIQRIQKIKDEIESIKESKSRLTGEIEGNQKRQKELVKELLEKHSISPKEISSTIESLEKQIEESLKEAERILGL